MRLFRKSGLVVTAALWLMPTLARAQNPVAELAQPEEVVVMVHAAARLVETSGEQAFAEFHTENTRWLHGGTYVFVYDLDGQCLVDGQHPGVEGRDQSGLKDSAGRPIVASLLAAASGTKHRGWAHFLWPAGEGEEPAWKSCYVTQVAMPDGAPVVVGTGFYGETLTPYFVEETVDRAAEELAARGEPVLKSISNKLGLYSYADNYVVAFNEEGTVLAHGQTPDAIGRSIFSWRDAQDNSPAERLLDLTERAPFGWIYYSAAQPDSAQLVRMAAYVHKVDLAAGPIYLTANLPVPERGTIAPDRAAQK